MLKRRIALARGTAVCFDVHKFAMIKKIKGTAPEQAYLYRRDAKRCITRCQNGIIQLTWDEVQIHLRPANFARLVRLLETGVVELNLTEACDGRRCCLKQIAPGNFQLQLGRAKLELSLMDFLTLADMARLVARQQASVQNPLAV